MTDRYETLTVTLEDPIRSDDIEPLLHAIRLLDGVAGVEPGSEGQGEIHHAKQQLKHEIRQRGWSILDD